MTYFYQIYKNLLKIEPLKPRDQEVPNHDDYPINSISPCP